MPVATVEVGVGDVIKMGVGPEELVREVINGERVRPGQSFFVRDDSGKIGAIEAESTDVRLQMPGGEEKVSDARMDDDGTRVGNSVRLETATLRAVQLRDLDVLRMPIKPVELTTDPIDSETFQAHGILLDDGLFDARAIDKGSVNGLGVDVGEVETVFTQVVINGHNVAQVLMGDRVLFGVDRHVPHVILVGEYKPRGRVVTALAGVFVRFTLVIRLVALAIVGTGRIGTVLRANAGHFRALVYVGTGFAIGHQFITGIARTLVFNGSVDAQLATLMNFHLINNKMINQLKMKTIEESLHCVPEDIH